MLEERDRILAATVAAANVMLTQDDFVSAVNMALPIVGKGLDVDRVVLGQHFEPTSERAVGYFRFNYEWTSKGVSLQTAEAEGIEVSDQGMEFALESLKNNRIFGGIVAHLPEPFRSVQRKLGVKSTYAVPIRVNSEFWGVIALDDCRHTTQRSQAELEALTTLANCIGSAIERDRTRTEKEVIALARAAELETYNQDLRDRDALLNCVNLAVQRLVATDDLAVALPAVLEILGRGTRQCRSYILQNVRDKTQRFNFDLILEWDAPDIPDKRKSGRFPVPIDSFPNHLTAPLKAGRSTQFLARDLDGILPADRIVGQARSLVGVPIMIAGEWWGLLGLDNCEAERIWSEAEITVLETAATAIGNAIARDRARQAKAAAERIALIERERAARAEELEAANAVLTKRDRWLETTAAAANQLLSATDVAASVQAALATIGENLECNRVSVMQYRVKTDAPADSLGVLRVLYEWQAGSASIEADHQSNHRDNHQASQFKRYNISSDGIEDWFRQLLNGHWMGGIVDQIEEPLRSLQRLRGVKSTYAMPVFIEERLWGVVSIEHCGEAKQLSAAEIAVFQTAATCVSSAIYQANVRRDRAAQERSRLLSSVAEAANLLLKSADYTQVLFDVVRLLGKAVMCDRCSITRTLEQHIGEEQGFLKLKFLQEWHRTGIDRSPPAFFEAVRMPLAGDLLTFRRQLMKGEAASFISQNSKADYQKDFLAGHSIASMVVVPIMLHGEYWGEISFANCSESRPYSKAETAILQVAAESISAAISRQTQDEALRRAETAVLEERECAARDRATELVKLNETIARSLSTLTATPELDDFLGQLLNQMSEQISACKAYLFLYDKETDTLNQYVTIQAGELHQGTAPSDPELFRHPIPSDLSNVWERVVNSSKPFTLNRQSAQTEFCWSDTAPWHEAERHIGVAYACMKVGNKPIGFITFAFRHLPALTDEQLEFVQALTNQATLAIHLTRLAKRSQTAALSAALTDERNRLAREIHDTLAQSFTGISLQLEAAKGFLHTANVSTNPSNSSNEAECAAATSDLNSKLGSGLSSGLGEAEVYLNRAGELARQGLLEARRSVRALRSQALETDTLPKALQTAVREMTLDSALQTKFDLLGVPYDLPEDIQTNLLRIGQEALTNTLRHAQAQHFSLLLQFEPHWIRLHIADDGQGCEIESFSKLESFGLIGMRERVLGFGGQFTFESAIGEGTVIEVVIPVPGE